MSADQSTTKRGHAAELLAHYLQRAYRRAGLSWTASNDEEVREIVDLIVNAAVEEVGRG